MDFKKTLILIFLSCVLFNVNVKSTDRDYWPKDSWQSKFPSELQMDSLKLLELDTLLKDKLPYVNSFIITRNGYIVYEKFQNGYRAEETSLVASCTKSLTNVILGILLKDGYVNSIDDTVLNYLPEYNSVNTDPRIHELTFRHLSTFTSGLDHSDRNGWEQGDMIANYLGVPFKTNPGRRFNYETPASHVISAVVNKTTGLNAYDFAREEFLDTIGFKNFSWENVNGVSTGGWGSYMRVKDMLRLGFLYLNHGIWNGDTIVEPAWVNSSTVRVTNGGSPHNAGYGRNWWVAKTSDYEYYFAGGYGGQFIIVIPDFDIVIASQCDLNEHRESPRYLVHSHIIPAILDKPEQPVVHIRTELTQSISVYPNPVKNVFSVQFSSNINDDTRLNLVTISGRKVLDMTVSNIDSNLFDVHLPDDIAPGVYLLTIYNNNFSFNKKIVIQ